MWKMFVRPVELFMNQLTYIKKFMCIVGIGGVLVMIINLQLMNVINQDLENAKNQQIGAHYNTLLKDLMRNVQQHRGMAGSYLSGDETIKPRVVEKQKEIVQVIQSIQQQNIKDGTLLQTISPWQSIEKQWYDIEQNVFNLQENKSFQQHTDLVDAIKSLMNQVGNQSSLVLDSQLDRHYLIMTSIRELPSLAEDLGQLRARGTSIINRENMTEVERNQLLALKSSAETKLSTVEYNLHISMTENPSLSGKIQPLVENLNHTMNQYFQLIEKEILSGQEIEFQATEYFATATTAIDSGFEIFDTVSDLLASELQKNVANQENYKLFLIFLNVGISVIVMYFFIGFYVSTMRAIKTLNQTAHAIAGGDLTARARLETKDELSHIGLSFNEMAQSLARLIESSKSVSNQLAVASEELSASAQETMKVTNAVAEAAQQVSLGSETQVASSKESSVAIEEMAQGITRVAESAGSIAESANRMTERARNGNKQLGVTVEQMGQIEKETIETSQSIVQLQEDAQEIGGILEIITNISSQTNLLALNAAIEAARAGDAGRGFAVVADEIRKLADQTSQATGSIQLIIEKIRKNVDGSVASMDGNKKQVSIGIENIRNVEEMFKEILSTITEVSRQIEELSAVSEEMSAGTEEISASVHELANIAKESANNTQNIAASSQEQLAIMEEVTKAAETLESMADELNQLVSRFKV
ncbi:hypothetical protein BHU72_06175 [Desulfuribacillus stibiiarsenatis]|uniref:Chemotaxis protein n=1 Tax=Desulfuribacillus stibiiarsenatis TaxID=1390249 RepID=A0A1E5L4V0_9FIRM|nr:HAMP domain-containing methyl-accepting chemotaxis protein [Desulfuribacillus stibiiarsenatis]OEH85192.1 hypothetical protein BHU72_06175 [Desulfuribacillus stibiiarsenatis]